MTNGEHTDADADAAENAFDQISPIFTGLDCNVVATTLIYLVANWLLTIETDPPDPDETNHARVEALEILVQNAVRLMREHEEMRKNVQ